MLLMILDSMKKHIYKEALHMILNKNKLKACMAKKCYNTADLSKESGLSLPTIYRIMVGRRNISIKTVGIVCKSLGVNPEDVIESY